MMKCVHCGKGLDQVPALHRQNPKGEPGIWACDGCNMTPVDPAIQDLVEILNPNEPKCPPSVH